MKPENLVYFNGMVIGFRSNGKLYLTRCPQCERENYAPSVASGQCAWCGWEEEKEEESGVQTAELSRSRTRTTNSEAIE